MTRNASCACLAAWLSFVAGSAVAQTPSPLPDSPTADPPAHVAIVDGRVTLERDGRPEPSPLSMPLLSGDRLRTADGRVEVLFADGAALHLDSGSVLDFQSDELIRLLEGRLRLIIPGPRRELSYRVDTPGGWAQISTPGEYRVTVSGGQPAEQVELVVLRGSAELMNDDGGTSLRAGDRALARVGQAPSPAYVYNSAAWDAFDRWSDSRLSDRAGASAPNLPETVQSYAATFDRDGSWRADETYGQVWYPRVAADWRPYFSGRWASYPSYGWTWIGTEAWAWPTHHYGRWGFSAGAWFWIPGRTWSPAWVSWAYAPGYTSWCPLGWDNRAVLQFGRGYGGRYDHWNGWTVVANGRFGSGYVNTGYVGGGRIDVRTRAAFVVRGGAPQSRGGYAVPRNAAPIRVAGSRGPGGYGSSGGLGSPGVDRGRLEDARPGLGARGSVGASGRNGTGGGVDRGPGGAARGDARTDPAGARTSRAPAGTDARPRATRPEVIRGGVRSDEAAAFRDRRTQSEPSGAGYPAPARAPRDSPEVVQRMGAPRERTAAPRAFDPASVPVYRGAVPRSADQPADRGPDDRTDASRRGPAAAAPAGAQPAPRTWSSDDHRQAPSPGSRSPEAAPRGGQIDRTPSPYRAAPREAQPSAPPSYRSYGGDERRPSPGPAAAPPREGGGAGAPRGPAPSSGAGQSRERPQGQPDRGTAVRRGRGEN